MKLNCLIKPLFCILICALSPIGFCSEYVLDDSFKVGTFEQRAIEISVVEIQTDGKILVGGDISRIGGVKVSSLARLNIDGTVDTDFNPALKPSGSVFNSALIQPVRAIKLQSDGKIIVSSSNRNDSRPSNANIIRLNSNGSLDRTFNVSVNQGSEVNAIYVQSNGKILLTGDFSFVNGQAHQLIIRLNTDGSVDNTFDAGIFERTDPFFPPNIHAVGMRTNGQIIIGGDFASIQGEPRRYLAQLSHNGTLDQSFTGQVDGQIEDILILPTDKVIIGGEFNTQIDGTQRKLVRLNVNGTTDNSFSASVAGSNPKIKSVKRQPDGKLIVTGTFFGIGGTQRNGIARINDNGTSDISFTPITLTRSVTSTAIQTDGKIVAVSSAFNSRAATDKLLARLNSDGSLDNSISNFVERLGGGPSAMALDVNKTIVIGGDFTRITGILRLGLARIDNAGSVDDEFSPTLDNGSIRTVSIQRNGEILVGGNFSSINNVMVSNLARLTSNGAIDSTFTPNPDGQINKVYVQNDSHILVAGNFSVIANSNTQNLARLKEDGNIDTSFIANVNRRVEDISISSDNKILIGGTFTQINGAPKLGTARLNIDGTLDDSFDSDLSQKVSNVLGLTNQKTIVSGLIPRERNELARLNNAGDIDKTFSLDFDHAFVNEIAADSNERILLGILCKNRVEV